MTAFRPADILFGGEWTPGPTTEDWRRWDQRLPAMAWVERRVWAAWQVSPERAQEELRRWAPAWLALSKMARPGSPEWCKQQQEETT